MIREYEVIPVLAKDNGETITYAEVNSIVKVVLTKFNRLNSFNCGVISTGKFVDFNKVGEPSFYRPLLYANYCGKMMYRTSPLFNYLNVNKADSIDQALAKVNTRLNNLLNKVT